MNITIMSIFANATHYLERYFDQIQSLEVKLHKRSDDIYLVLGYGDSTDGTGEALWDECMYRFPAALLDVSHGGEIYESIEHEVRFRQLAFSWNKLFGLIPPVADAVIFLESDLIWEANTLISLINHLKMYPVIAPMIFDYNPPDRFRDVYAFRRNGVRFTNEFPYHSDLNGEVLQVDSAGSVLAMRASIARKVRVSREDAVVGLCRRIYEQGDSIWVDPKLSVTHP